MPQETDSSSLISLLSAIWIYWIVSSWWEHLHQLAQTQDARQQNDSTPLAKVAAVAGGAAASRNLDILISEILRREAATTIDDFLAKVLAAYETIVAAFNAGDRETLSNLVSPEVYEAFSGAIDTREASKTSMEIVFARIEPPEIIDGEVDATHMEVSVRIVGEAFRLSRDAAGQLIEEAPAAFRSVDTWTFARKLSPRDTSWLLVATAASG